MAFQTGGMIGRVVDVERIEVPAAETTLTVAVGAEVSVIFLAGCSSVSASPATKIVSGVVTKVVSTIFKRLWLLKPTCKTAISSRSMMKFESGYTVETRFDGSKHGIEPYSVEISTNEEIFILDSVNGHIHKISSPLTRFLTRDDKVRVPCEKVAEEGGFGGYLRRGIAVAFSRGGCAWPDAADLEEATGLRRGSGRLSSQTVIEAHDRQHGGAAKMVDRWGEPDSSRCVLAVSMLGRESDLIIKGKHRFLSPHSSATFYQVAATNSRPSTRRRHREPTAVYQSEHRTNSHHRVAVPPSRHCFSFGSCK
ncbi:hypothetical protein CASFOL_030293 [Castilleja foliolosa]|uniref:Uncharacterized protein n=1 Tax=Castilleja foliolosa TaxID=1961234 RepID=A0ABD3C8X8_9LAMI